MPPKKAKVEEAVDKPPEGDDERLVTITLRATFVPGFLSGLKSPILVVAIQPDDVVKIELTADQVAQQELNVQVFSKKVAITPAFVDNVLGGRPTITLCSLPDAKEPSSSVVAGKAGGKAAQAPAAKGPGKGPLSVLDVPLDDLVHQAVIPFDFCGVLITKEVVMDPLVGSGASLRQVLAAASITVACSDPLLAPSNIAKYQPVVVEVTSVSNLPSDGAIALEHDGMYESSLPAPASGGTNGNPQHSAGAGGSSSTNVGVYVEFDFLGETVRTGEVRREANVAFGFRRAFFLYQQPRLSLMQRLFRPVTFEVHDQDHIKSKLRPSFGVANVNLRPAVTEQVKRFASSTQLLPNRDVVEGVLPPADYVSYGTTLKTVIEFLVPLSKPTYVAEAASQPGEILSRTVLIMPYTGSVVVPALQAIMGTLVSLKKGGTESQVREADISGEGSTNKKGGTSPLPSMSSSAAAPFRVHVPAGITGFEVIDDEYRMMCFEGPLSTVHKLAEVATSIIGDDPSCRVLMNAELQFPQRYYCLWPPLVAPLEDPMPKAPSPVAAAPEVSTAQGKASAPAPGGKKAPPGKKKAVEAEPVVKSQVQQEMEDAPPEIDAGGVGGRIRRIRLGTTIAKLAGTQRNFIKRSLPLDAVRCINRLKQLRSLTTILQAVDLNAFPTTTELIALERIHGQTLELIDVCGVNEFVSFSDADVSGIVKKAQEDAERLKLCKVREVDLTALLPEDIGLVVSFVGVPANSVQRQGCSFGPAFRKFKHKGFMFSLTHQQTILCAFSVEPPSQMLRHAFTAQIVSGDDGVPVPFVLAFHSLAHKPSDHINTLFDAKLRKDKQRAPAKEYFTQLAARTAHYNATHQLSLDGTKYHDESSDDDEDFVDTPPAVVQGLDQPELIPNYVVLNRSIAAQTASGGAATSSSSPSQSDYAMAQKLYDLQSQRLAASAASAAASHIEGRNPFRTQPHKTSTETRHHPQAPSQQRVDDLKQQWEPPAGYKGTKTGPNPFRFNGARHVLDDEARDRSLASLMNPVERRQQELQDQKETLESWQRQVVVDDTSFHVSGRAPKDHVESQLDKARNILEDPPKKLSLKRTHVPGAPTSMFTHEQPPPVVWVDPATEKHPEDRRFYYPHGYPTSVAPKPISPQERLSPLYGREPSATHPNS